MSSRVTFSLYLTICVTLLLQASGRNFPTFPKSIHIPNVLHHYIEMCGIKQLCNVSEGLMELAANYSYGGHECPPCECDTSCHVTGTCCPDIAIHQCHSVYAIQSDELKSSELVTSEFIMVSICPDDAEHALKNECQEQRNKENFLFKYPVTSLTTNMTYKNKYCAICNNETNFQPWGVEIKCDNQNDFYLLSSPEDIWDTADRRGCNVLYTNGETKYSGICFRKFFQRRIVDKCNVTGSWDTYDPDIEWACLNYDSVFRIFRNVFCYMCNSGKISDHSIISSCNISGMSSEYSTKTEIRCKTFPQDGLYLPYKNRFCYYCNLPTRTDTTSDKFLFNDSSIYSITHQYKPGSTFPFQSRMRINSIQKYVKFRNLNENVDENKSQITPEPEAIATKDNYMNVSTLYDIYKVAGGKQEWCFQQKSSAVEYDDYSYYSSGRYEASPKCECSSVCILENDCCPDYDYERLMACERTVYYDHKRIAPTWLETKDYHYFLSNKCDENNQLNLTIKEMCETPQESDLFSILPVQSISSKINYRNFYCYLCSSEYVKTNDVIFWNTHISCKRFVNFEYFTSFESLYKFSRLEKCLISFTPVSDGLASRCRKPGFVDKCNVTGNWLSYDSEVKHACEDPVNIIMAPETMVGINMFCQICNFNTFSEVIQQCNISGRLSKINATEKYLCENSEKDENHFPFKNKYCESCNLEFDNDNRITPALGGHRSIFSVKQIIDSVSETGDKQDCQEHQVLDKFKKRCRDLLCPQGKQLVQGKCRPLLSNVDTLGYSLSFEGEITFDAGHLEDVEIAYPDNIIFQTFHQLNITNFKNGAYYMLLNFPCGKQEDKRGIFYISNNKLNSTILTLTFYLHVQMQMISSSQLLGSVTSRQNSDANPSLLDRQYLDERMAMIIDHPMNLKINEKSYEFAPKYSKVASSLSSGNLPYNPTKFCKVFQRHGNGISDQKQQFLRPVSKLLVCTQVEIGIDEYKYVETKVGLELPEINLKIGNNDYKKDIEGNVRLCLDDYVTGSTRNSETKLEVTFRIFSDVITILSLTCLAATFIIYCSIKSLRSIPGLNLMCLMVSLFFAQLFLKIGQQQTSRTFCQINGILTHYFWLSTFCCLNICSFHMFRVFCLTSVRFVENSKTKTRVLLQYCLYSYAGPLVIIVINITIALLVSGNIHPTYSDSSCFLSELLSYIFTFIVPVSIMSLCNIVFFAATSNVIRKQVHVKSNQSDYNKVKVCFKLFLITGISWLLLIIEANFSLSAFSFVVEFANGCQGIFIFIAYVCNKRMFDKLRRPSSNKSSSQNDTKTERISTSTQL